MSKFTHTARLQTLGYWGVSDPPALSWNLDFAKCFAQTKLNATKANKGFTPLSQPVSNLRILDNEFERNYAIAKKKKQTGAPGVILDYSLFYPNTLNNSTKPIITPSADAVYLEYLSNAFNGPGYGYTRNQGRVTGEIERGKWVTIAGQSIGSDESFARRFYLHKAPKTQNVPFWIMQWGKYAFRVIDGRASLAKLTDKWTFAKERELWTKREIAADDTETTAARDAASDAAATIEREIFLYQQSVNSDGEMYGRPHELIVIGTGSTIAVFLDGKFTEVPAFGAGEIQTEADYSKYVYSPLWNETTITTASTGAFFWSNGYPEFRAAGEIRLGSMLGVWESSADLPLAQIDSVVNGWIPNGTAVSVAKRYQKDSEGNDTKRVEIVANLSTTNRRVTPVAFRCGLVLKGGPLDGEKDVSFDTEALSLANIDKDAILDVVPEFDGEGRRRQFKVLLRLKRGENLSADFFPALVHKYDLLEDRVCNLWLDGQKVLTGGIVAAAELIDAASVSALAGLPPVAAALARSGSALSLTICDGWFLLEEKRTRDEIGDGRFRGYYLRLMLGNAGFSSAQLAGISNMTGGRLRVAFPGEDWKIRPRRGQRYADWIRQFITEQCPGYVLYQDANGVWQFHLRNRAVLARFSSSAATNKSNVYPAIGQSGGRYTILRQLNLQRDTKAAEFANSFSLVGGDDGEVNRNWRIEKSIRDIGGARSPAFVGRVIEADLIEDSSVMSIAEADTKLRRKIEDQELPRFADVPTYFHTAGAGGRNFFPGDFVEFDGVKCKIVRGASGSLREDRMSFGVQQAAR